MRKDLSAYANCQVFLNYPFDDGFRGLAEAMSFAVIAGGLLPVCAFDLAAPDRPRLEMLVDAIRNCQYSAHDLSRSQGEGPNNFARMNMPIEMGMALFHALDAQRRDHRCLFLVSTPHDYKNFASDVAGLDPRVHNGDEGRILTDTYEWLRAVVPATLFNSQPTVDVIDRFPDVESRAFEEAARAANHRTMKREKPCIKRVLRSVGGTGEVIAGERMNFRLYLYHSRSSSQLLGTRRPTSTLQLTWPSYARDHAAERSDDKRIKALSLTQFMPEDHTNELRDVALRKIARNLVNFQRFERMLKLVIVQSDVRGCASKLAKVYRDSAKNTDRKTLGWLVEEFFKTIYSNDSFNDGSPNELDEVWMSISVRVDSDRDSIRNRKRELSELVTERNWLIHSSLADLDLDSVESCKKLISLLDAQDNRLKPHYESLMRLISNVQVAQQELFKQSEAHLRESLREGEDAG